MKHDIRCKGTKSDEDLAIAKNVRITNDGVVTCKSIEEFIEICDAHYWDSLEKYKHMIMLRLKAMRYKWFSESKKREEKCNECVHGTGARYAGWTEKECPCKCHLPLTETHTIEPKEKCIIVSCEKHKRIAMEKAYRLNNPTPSFWVVKGHPWVVFISDLRCDFCKPEEPKPECDHEFNFSQLRQRTKKKKRKSSGGSY